MFWQADDELDHFKRDIDLRAYAESLGYEFDPRDSWKGAFVMRRGDDKLKISYNDNGHWIYSSYRDIDDNGTIVDFVQRRRVVNLGEVRQELRAWAGASFGFSGTSVRGLTKVAKDRVAIQQEFAGMREDPDHPYLRGERAIPGEILRSKRFEDRIRVGPHGAAVFPHFDEEGLCGYELKNKGFTGFSAGGTKGLWCSQMYVHDDCLIFFESAIEALSYATLYGDDDHYSYVSTAGYVGIHQRELIQKAISFMPPNSDIVAAMNQDEGGRALAGIICNACRLVARDDLTFFDHVPKGFKDWNEQLKARGKDLK